MIFFVSFWLSDVQELKRLAIMIILLQHKLFHTQRPQTAPIYSNMISEGQGGRGLTLRVAASCFLTWRRGKNPLGSSLRWWQKDVSCICTAECFLTGCGLWAPGGPVFHVLCLSSSSKPATKALPHIQSLSGLQSLTSKNPARRRARLVRFHSLSTFSLSEEHLC